MPATVKRSKRYQKRAQLVDREKRYSLADALKNLKKIDSTLLERGWKAATADIEPAPSFKGALTKIVEYFK